MENQTEVNASQKHSCPACGGECIWNPSKHTLVCPFCGTTSAIEENEGEIKEHDLATALRAIPDEKRGWATETKSVRCQHCLAISVFSADRVGQKCDFCGSSQLVPYEETKAPFKPESVLPLKISESQARDLLKEWVAARWFAPNNLLRLTRTDQVKGMYLPFWTFDAQVEAEWYAEAGHYYYTTETYTDNQGTRRTRQVRSIRWEPSSGHLSHFFNDELVPASRGIDSGLLEGVSPFPTEDLTPYDPAFVKGWVVEHYQIDLVDAASLARTRMITTTESMCGKQVPGDTYRNLQVSPQFDQQTFKHILAPIWAITYLYNGKTFQVIANGVTGKIKGKYPLSWVKIVAAAICTVLLVILVFYMIGLENTAKTMHLFLS